MRDGLESFYRALLRLQGGYILMFCGLFLFGLPSAIGEGKHVMVPTLLTLAGGTVGAIYAVPRLTPGFLAKPAGLVSLLGLAPWHSVIPMLFVLVQMSAVILHDLPEPLSRNLSVLTSLASFALSGVMFWLCIALGLWRATGPNGPAMPHTPPRLPRQPVDARALRHARTTR